MISWSKFDKFAPYCFIKTSNRIAGCARGIGNALAKHLDKKGFHVFASCRDPKSPGAEDLRKSCSSRLQVFQLDAANDESVEKAVLFVKDNLGTCVTMVVEEFVPSIHQCIETCIEEINAKVVEKRQNDLLNFRLDFEMPTFQVLLQMSEEMKSLGLWAIINNAGIQRGFLLELSSIQDFKDSLEVNALGPARVTKAFLPLLRESRGRVINMGSVVGQSLSEINDNMLFFQSPILPFL
ncbi:hypothetical protein AVEN_221971-1 [Araneus ventricosus]|uniref:Estradiol 17-beta-dehydrogenase 2 n=1 Tax=Araneus ventricosus TaxID=182803 RepID=A0A4Y2F8M1_ARAVE|nr:hypothetical protein AVEN_221971-1 [Araneus ventricosus]